MGFQIGGCVSSDTLIEEATDIVLVVYVGVCINGVIVSICISRWLPKFGSSVSSIKLSNIALVGRRV